VPLANLRLSAPFISFTDARLAFTQAGRPMLVDFGALLVNSSLLTWAGDVGDERAPETDPHLLAALLEPA
jgi:hypothetical protein